MISVLLFLYLMVLGCSQSTQPPIYMPPSLIETSQANMLQNGNSSILSNMSYLSMDTTDHFISRLSTSGTVEIYSIETGALMFNTFREYVSKTIVPPIINYDLQDNENGSLAILSNNNQAYIYRLYANGTSQNFYISDVVPVSINPRYDIQMFKDQFLFCVTNSGTAGFSRRRKTVSWLVAYGFPTPFLTPANNLKICQSTPTDPYFRVALWKRNCYVIVTNCSVSTSTCNQIYVLNNTACTSTEYSSPNKDYYKLSWNRNCTKILFESKNKGLLLIDVTKNTTVTFSVTSSTSSLSGFWFLDNLDQFVGVSKPNGYFEIYNVTAVKMVERKTLSASMVTSYNRLKKVFYITSGVQLISYVFGCTNASYYLNNDGLCQFDPLYVPPPQVNTTNQTEVNQTTVNQTTSNTSSNQTTSNTGSQSATNDTSNQTSNTSTDNQTSNTNTTTSSVNETQINIGTNMTLDQILDKMTNNFLNLVKNDSSLLEYSANYINQMKQNTAQDSETYKWLVSPQAQLIQESISSFLDVIAAPVTVTSNIMKAMPCTFLYIGYINFWFVLSLYKFAPIDLPKYLAVQLKAVYEMISSSMFQNFGWEIQFGTNSQEKFEQQLVTDGLSSNLIKSNIESFIMISFSYLVLGLTYLIQKKLPQQNFVRKKLQTISYKLALSGQFVGIMNAFFFNLPIISKSAWQDVFQEKINMALQNFFFVFSMFFSCLVVFFISQIVERKKCPQERRIQRLNWFFDSQCNCLLPIFVMFDIVPLFLTFNALFFCIPIYTAWKEQKTYRILRVIAIIKSLYLQMFNTGIVLIVIFSYKWFDSKEYDNTKSMVTIVTTCIVGIGALHEVLQLLCGLLYDVFRMLRALRNKVANYNEKEVKESSDKSLVPKVANVITKDAIAKDANNLIHLDETVNVAQDGENAESIGELVKRVSIRRQSDDEFIERIGKNVNTVEKRAKTKIRLKKHKNTPEYTKTAGVLDVKVNFEPNQQQLWEGLEKGDIQMQQDKIKQGEKLEQREASMKAEANMKEEKPEEKEQNQTSTVTTKKIREKNTKKYITQAKKEKSGGNLEQDKLPAFLVI